MQTGFAAQVANWEKKADAAQTDVLHQSLRLLVEAAIRPKSEGGNMPVVKGNLRNSVAVSALAPVAIDWTTKKFRDPFDAVNNAIAGIAIGETAYIGFRAPYAHKLEVDNGFLRLAAQDWKAIVDEAVRITKGGRA